MDHTTPSAAPREEEASAFSQGLEQESDFKIRQAVERLREGLFDPVAVRLLTAHEQRLREQVEHDFRAADSGKSPHLGIVGAYGQGKSHSLVYIQDLALRAGFAVSRINLDPREVVFRQFRDVYRALMAELQLPGSGETFAAAWKRWAQEQMKERGDFRGGLRDLLPGGMPHCFKTVLAAMAHGTVSLSEKEKRQKQHAAFRPKEFPMLLLRALEGEAVPTPRLRKVFQYRQVSFYKEGPLSCRGPEPFFRMVRSLSCLIKQMGYRGWVLLFDEAESIVQAHVFARSKSYRLLDRLFHPEPSEPAFLYPVFAFTEDFFQRVHQEEYDRVMVRADREIPYFDRNYATQWRDLNLYRLHDLSRKEWEELSGKLVDLHARAYRWEPPRARVDQEMARRLEAMQSQETRLKLKALVETLDLVHQEQVL